MEIGSAAEWVAPMVVKKADGWAVKMVDARVCVKVVGKGERKGGEKEERKAATLVGGKAGKTEVPKVDAKVVEKAVKMDQKLVK